MSELEHLRTGLSGRFDIRRELGRGGMAIVYLAHDIRHDREVALKVMRPEMRTSVSAERFLREIRFAARLQHPHILPLYDSGVVDDAVFYVMPFVEGESLRERLARLGGLPIAESLAIATQVAEALAVAHAQGIVHRDIKPENILLTAGEASSGEPFALVADFGIARALSGHSHDTLTGTGLMIGTPAYASPEQAAGDAVDARSDVYSLGCVLYEMLAGKLPFSRSELHGAVPPQVMRHAPAVADSRKDVPAAVDAIVRTALAMQPGDRFQSAFELAAALRAAAATATPRGTPHRQMAFRFDRRLTRAVAVTAGVLLLGATAAVVEGWPSGIRFSESDWIVVANVDNRTGDDIFDGSLTTALVSALQQSQHVNVVPASRVREILRHMQRPDTTALDEATAREVAQRIGSPLVLATSLTRIDSTYQLTAQLLDPPRGNVLETISERAAGRSNVLGALDDVVARVRRALNEPGFAIRGSRVPLPLGTTASLEALKRYADGNREWYGGRFENARDLYLQALSYDSTFAQAHAAVGGAYYWANQRPEGDRHFALAESRLPQLTERERLILGAQIAGWKGKRDEQILLLKTYLAQYPRDEIEWYNLGTALFRSRRCEEALPAFAKTLEIDSLHVNSRINSALCHRQLGRPEEAVALYRDAFRLSPDLIRSGNLNHEFGTLLLNIGDREAARRTYGLLLDGSVDERARALRSMGLLEMVEGRFDTAISNLRAAIVQTRVQNALTSEYRNRLYLAVALQHVGRQAAMRAQLDTAYRIFGQVYLEPWLLAYGGCLFARAGQLHRAAEVRDTLIARLSVENIADVSARDVLEAEIVRAEGGAEKAVGILELAVARPSGSRAYVLESLAEALADAGDFDAATTRFKEVIAERSIGWEAQEGWLLAPYRLALIAEARSDTTAALEWYARFLDQWKNGDDTVIEIREARRRMLALSGPG